MNQEMIQKLSVITLEEQAILGGRQEIDRTLYMKSKNMVMDSRKLLEHGKLISLRPHTRFVHFPKHSHNYVEMVYMCQGSTTHIVDGNRLVLKEGEILILNQHATQEILPAGKDDIAVNFIILPQFFDTAFRMMGEEENLLRNFIVGSLCGDTRYDRYLHFQVSGILPVQNLMENMVWTLLNPQPMKRSINQTTMGLLFLYLIQYADRIRVSADSAQSFDQQISLQVLSYIDANYRDGTLTELAANLNCEVCWLSRTIKQLFGRTYKELLQIKRLNQASFLLLNTKLSIADISVAVGYDNTSYFHRIFREYYHLSPGDYRREKHT